MKTVLITLVLGIAFLINAEAQHRITNQINDKKITKISENLYQVEVFDETGKLLQNGQYWKKGKRLLPHGQWTLYAQGSNEILTSATYVKGEQVYVETIVDGNVIRADKKLLALKRLAALNTGKN